MLYYDFFCVFFFSIFLSFFFFFNDTATTEIYTLSLHDALPIFRTAFASLTALFTGLIIGPLVINRLREFQIGQYIREEGPKAHQKKAGTPTMGGILIVISVVVPTLLWADLSNPFVWIAVLSTTAFAAIGFTDDYTKTIHKRNLGLTARAKLALQTLVSILIAVALIA